MKLISITSKRVIAKWGLPAILLSGLAGFFTTDLSELITWATIARHYADISNFIEQNQIVSYFAFTLFYITVVAFSLPIASLLTLAAGALIGWPSIGLIVLAAAGASLLFIASRLLRDFLRARAGHFLPALKINLPKMLLGIYYFEVDASRPVLGSQYLASFFPACV